MLWLVLALSAAFFVALGDAFNKKFFARDGMVTMVLARTLGPVPLLALFLWFTFPLGQYQVLTWKALHTPAFLKTVALLLPLETLALVLYMEAIRISPLSLTLPLLSFTPAFIILTGYLVLGERLSWFGISGIILVVAGSYLLHAPVLREGLAAPFKALFKEKGSLLMLGVALIYAITSVLGKKALLLTDPLWFAGTYFIVLGFFAPAVLCVLKPCPFKVLKKKWFPGVFLLGLTQALMVITHMKAISLAPAAYMIAVKRTSILFGVVLGRLFFQESHWRMRLLSAFIMFLGVLLLSLAP